MRPRQDEWLATGDIAERQESGELRFLGRKSEVIVTAAGVNIHPEDIESAIEEEPDVAACAVVAMETPTVWAIRRTPVRRLDGLSSGAGCPVRYTAKRYASESRGVKRILHDRAAQDNFHQYFRPKHTAEKRLTTHSGRD